MPYDHAKLAAMNADDPEEYLTKEQIAKRLGIHSRNVERLVERFQEKLRRNQRPKIENGKRKVSYRWTVILECAKIHTGLLEIETPSKAVKRANAKRRADELAIKEELIQWIQGDAFPGSSDVRNSASWVEKHHPKQYEKWKRILAAFNIDLDNVLQQRRIGLPVSFLNEISDSSQE